MGPDHTPRSHSDAWSDLLDRYYAGECSADERTAIEKELATKPRVVYFFRALRQVLQGDSVGVFDLNTGLQRAKRGAIPLRTVPVLEQKLQNHEGGLQRTVTSKSLRAGSFKTNTLRRWIPQDKLWYSILGCLIVTCGVLIGRNWTSGRSIRPAMSTYATTNGQRATVTLPDGNTVMLDVASRLEVPADYMNGHHIVRLVGEGLFNITHHTRTSFSVVAGTSTTQVLGTSFLVRHYATDSSTTVAVRDGKVVVHAVTHELVLAAAQQVSMDFAGRGAVQPGDPAQFGFAKGVLTLRRMSLSSAIPELNRWYDADIRLSDPSLGSRQLEGDFAAGSLADLATILGWTLQVRVERDGRVLTIDPR